MKNILAVAICVLLPFPILASEYPYKHCFSLAEKKTKVDKNLLASIAKVESNFNSLAKNENKNGSIDIGIMQINSWWLSQPMPFDITTDNLFKNPCLNILVGAWILSENFKSKGINWTSVGAYNAGFSKKKNIAEIRYRYAHKVYLAYKKIQDRSKGPRP